MGIVDPQNAAGIINVRINDLDIANGNKTGRALRGADADVFTSETVVAHELYGHVYSANVDLNGGRPRRCADGQGECAMNQENRIRKEMGVPLRKYYDPVPREEE
jgi:hypothetical protein